MPKKFPKSLPFQKVILAIMAVAIIFLSIGVLLEVNRSSDIPLINISLGGLSYHLVNGKVVERSDKYTISLKNKLSASAKKDLFLGCTHTYYRVTAYTPNEQQVLLSYGCPYPNANMFAIYTHNQWKFISPTNKFNGFGIPLCDFVNANGISPTIAPVCTSSLANGSYSVR